MKDVAWAIRSLRTAPAFTATAALILALGIGASTAVYTVLYAAMLRPLPYEDPDRIVTVLLEDDRGEAGDPAVLGIVVAGLVLFALPAAAIPARRALRLEPAVTLRKE